MKINTYQKGKRRLSMVPARGNYKIKPAREKFIKNYIRMGVWFFYGGSRTKKLELDSYLFQIPHKLLQQKI